MAAPASDRLDDGALMALADGVGGHGVSAWADALLEACGAVPDPAAPLGIRDARLLDVHDALFGPRLDCVAECPGCGAALEIQLAAAALRHPAALADAGPLTLVADGSIVRFRLPGPADLAAAEAAGSAAAAEQVLLDRCVLGEGPIRLSPTAVAAVAAAMAAADPQADLAAALTCAVCGSSFEAPVDIARFLRRRVEQRAEEVLLEVHQLATAYHWSEAAILAMPRTRRQRYCALLEA